MMGCYATVRAPHERWGTEAQIWGWKPARFLDWGLQTTKLALSPALPSVLDLIGLITSVVLLPCTLFCHPACAVCLVHHGAAPPCKSCMGRVVLWPVLCALLWKCLICSGRGKVYLFFLVHHWFHKRLKWFCSVVQKNGLCVFCLVALLLFSFLWVSFFPCVPLVSQFVPLQAMHNQGFLHLLLPFSHHFPPCFSLDLHRHTVLLVTCLHPVSGAGYPWIVAPFPAMPLPCFVMFICQPRAVLTFLALQEPWTILPSQQWLLGCTCPATESVWTWQSLYTQFHFTCDVALVLPSVSYVPEIMLALLVWSPYSRSRLPTTQTHHRHCMWAVPASAAKGLLACLAWLASSSWVCICRVFWNLSGRAGWNLLGLAARLLSPSFCSEQGWCPCIFISTLMSNSMSLFGSLSSSLCQDASGCTWLYPALWYPCGDSCEGGDHPLLLHLLWWFGNRVGVRTWLTVASGVQS